jgi:formylglycine-generating enzyme required for sulfatase activity
MRRTIFFLLALNFALQSCFFLKKTNKNYEPEMVLVEGGTFVIGDIFESENTDALPVHEVTLKSFYIGKYEVTFEQFDEFALATGRELPDDNGYGRGRRAVVNVTWDDALAFCRSLGQRLPTEEEWEYAARSQGKEDMFAGTSNPDSLKDYAVLRSSNINFSFIIGQKKPNDLGLYDMSGNVFEWIGEYYQFYREPENLHDLDDDGIRIIRGGSFGEEQMATRTYWRVGTLRDVTATDLGFRCVDPK